MSDAGCSSSSNPSEHIRFSDDYKQWMQQQEAELDELVAALVDNPSPRSTVEELARLVEKNLDGFQTYTDGRKALAEEDILEVFFPTWCTTLEKSFFWLGGCRPTVGIHLIFGLAGLEFESRLEQIRRRVEKGDISEISPSQLNRINDLYVSTIGEEDRLSRRMALLQEEVADSAIMGLVRKGVTGGEAMDGIEPLLKKLEQLMLEADVLRLKTTKEIVRILHPRQGVEYLTAVKQLQLSFHKWGIDHDMRRGGGGLPNLAATT